MAPSLAPVPTENLCEPKEDACPAWCSGSADDALHQAHESAAVEWLGPVCGGSRYDAAALSVTIGLLDEGEGQRPPEIWLGAGGTWTELDLFQFESAITELEEYTVALRALKYRYAAILGGASLSSQDAYAGGPKHPVEVTSLCPAWCHYREEGHTDGAPEDRFHCRENEIVELGLHQPSVDSLGVVAQDEIQVGLEQPACSRFPRLAFTIERGSGGFCNLSLSEARQLRTALGELIARAELCATPNALPPVDSVTTHMRAKVVEDSQLDPESRGYALADTSPDGKVWVCIPEGMSADLREEIIRSRLAGAFQEPRRARTTAAPGVPLHVTGDRAAWVKASARAAA
ncbi:hypothetical protein [Streptomyces parvus]|uniref:hypothetical protein n=1 Tax=Streptomyces parvus TaxID=66428 RepID=UPI00340F5CBC